MTRIIIQYPNSNTKTLTNKNLQKTTNITIPTTTVKPTIQKTDPSQNLILPIIRKVWYIQKWTQKRTAKHIWSSNPNKRTIPVTKILCITFSWKISPVAWISSRKTMIRLLSLSYLLLQWGKRDLKRRKLMPIISMILVKSQIITSSIIIPSKGSQLNAILLKVPLLIPY